MHRVTFKRQYLWNCESKCENAWHDSYRFWYLPSNGAIAKVELPDFDLLFQGQLFRMLISRQRWEPAQNVKRLYRFWYLPRRLYCLTLIYIFKVKIANSHYAVSPALPPLARQPLLSCSCFILLFASMHLCEIKITIKIKISILSITDCY